MHRAIFLDRDGVINYPILNPTTKEYESPHHENDLKLFPNVIEALEELLKLQYKIFLISNQPDYAKGKTSLENLHKVHNKLHSMLVEKNITFTEYYYCYHHPKGIIKEYSVVCKCRKPGNLFLKQAALKYSLDLRSSWMIGDRDMDIYCGQSVGANTIMIVSDYSKTSSGQSKPDYKANDLHEAVEIIKNKHATH